MANLTMKKIYSIFCFFKKESSETITDPSRFFFQLFILIRYKCRETCKFVPPVYKVMSLK